MRAYSFDRRECRIIEKGHFGSKMCLRVIGMVLRKRLQRTVWNLNQVQIPFHSKVMADCFVYRTCKLCRSLRAFNIPCQNDPFLECCSIVIPLGNTSLFDPAVCWIGLNKINVIPNSHDTAHNALDLPKIQ